MAPLTDSDGTPARILASVLVAVGCLLCLYYVVQYASYTMDDAFITFRYARNLAHGDGLVFNPGEYPRAEGITSPLYAAFLSLSFRVAIDVALFSRWIGIAATILSCVTLFGIITRLVPLTTRLPAN